MKEGIVTIDNYKSLPLGLHAEIIMVGKTDGLEEIDKQVKVISILTGLTEDEVLNLPINDYKECVARSRFLERELGDPPARCATSYKVGGFDLVPVTDMKKVTTAQYIDFQSFHRAGVDEHFAEILSCLLVPRGKKYNQDYDIIEVQDALRKELSVFDGCCLYAFFMVSCRESIEGILTFSLQETKTIRDRRTRSQIQELIRKGQALLRRSGDGLRM